MEEWKYGYNGIHYGFNGRMGMEMKEWGKTNGKNGYNGRMGIEKTESRYKNAKNAIPIKCRSNAYCEEPQS